MDAHTLIPMPEIYSDHPTLPVPHGQDSGEEEVESAHDDSQAEIIQLPHHNVRPSLELLSTGEEEVESAHDDSQAEIIQPPHHNVWPSYELLATGERYFQICVPLRKAALKGNLKEFYNILRVHEDILDRSSLLRMAITKGNKTILHVAAGARQTNFVEEIINLIQPSDESTLLLQDRNGNTSFCFAAAAGDVEIVNIMLNKNPNLNQALLCGNHRTWTPLYMAVMFGRKEMASFLYDRTTNYLEQNELTALFFMSISTGLYDMALKLLNRDPELAVSSKEPGQSKDPGQSKGKEPWQSKEPGQSREPGQTALHMLARKPKSMTSQALELVQCLCQKVSTKPDAEVGELIASSTIEAAKLGNSEFLAALVGFYPDLIQQVDENNSSIFHIAISHRHANIFKLIYEMGFDKELLAAYEDHKGNNMLHLAGKYPEQPPASIVPGAALEMQQELLMFEEVEMIVGPVLSIDSRNIEGHTPKELFNMTHKDLQKRGEQWMKSTAKSCMLVATLVATVVFAAAFTIPGGSNQQVGRPIYLDDNFFKVFAASDAMALSSSSISILIFLSILTSRYEVEDFRTSLPLKLMFGLLTLFISVISMTIAFSSAFFLFYPSSERLNWITMSTALLVSVPVTLYAGLQYSLLRDIIYSTFCSRNQFKPK